MATTKEMKIKWTEYLNNFQISAKNITVNQMPVSDCSLANLPCAIQAEINNQRLDIEE